MVRLATVFSGIGAIEHALDRMNIEHKIVFACDNGEIDILNKDVGMNIDDIGEEIKAIDGMIQDLQIDESVEDLYKQQLYGMFKESITEYEFISNTLTELPESEMAISDVLVRIIEMPEIKVSKKKEYIGFKDELKAGSSNQEKFKALQIILELVNDYKKDNNLEELGEYKDFESSDSIKWKDTSADLKALYDYLESHNGKKIIRKMQDLSQRASQLYEKINYLKVQKQLEDFGDDWKKRKSFVDDLYKGLEQRNKVKQSYMANYDVAEEDFHWNVAFLNGNQYRDQVDLFVGGSPCQSFSLVGKQRGLEDTRGTLFYEYARLINEIRPKVFIYENVRAVLSHDGGNTWKKRLFTELGGIRFSTAEQGT